MIQREHHLSRRSDDSYIIENTKGERVTVYKDQTVCLDMGRESDFGFTSISELIRAVKLLELVIGIEGKKV